MNCKRDIEDGEDDEDDKMKMMTMMMRTMLAYLIDPIFLHLCVVCQPRPDWTKHKILFFVKYFPYV